MLDIAVRSYSCGRVHDFLLPMLTTTSILHMDKGMDERSAFFFHFTGVSCPYLLLDIRPALSVLFGDGSGFCILWLTPASQQT